MTQQRNEQGADLIGDFQRWLVRSGARGVSRGVGDQIRTALGRRGDVWEDATAPPSSEPPECAWCPLCRARRALRESGPGLASQMAQAGNSVASLIGDAVSVAEAVITSAGTRPDGRRQDAPGRSGRPAEAGPGAAAREDPWNAAAQPGPAEGLPHEPDDRG